MHFKLPKKLDCDKNQPIFSWDNLNLLKLTFLQLFYIPVQNLKDLNVFGKESDGSVIFSPKSWQLRESIMVIIC